MVVAWFLTACVQHGPADLDEFRRPAPGGGVPCGVERWAVKTLSDPDALSVDLVPVDTTVAALGALPAPTVRPSTRLPEERHTWRVTAILTEARVE